MVILELTTSRRRSSRDGHYRTIEVQAQNQEGLRIHSRKG